MAEKKIKKWEPEDFELEMTTHWSFPKRGDWATHDAKWRGNWSPYIPRNIILRYPTIAAIAIQITVIKNFFICYFPLNPQKCFVVSVNIIILYNFFRLNTIANIIFVI